ncbi:terminase small subunit [Devosia nitrariae]|uniref:Terminase small subunit n=1 Tax=Devosia nitrariae TaxID=2071872 RepID=A0ABQ5W1C9_9HYPH|nr:terminase small subunit [Devosia nitrariae]GLQ53609.1 hypothetical protein GCM10010862_08680 [Devosia nitrariae]
MPRNPKNEKAEAVRFVSSATLATMMGTTRGTVQSWIESGCPVVSRPSGPGQSFTLDLAEVVRWRLERATAEAEARAIEAVKREIEGGQWADDGGETEEQAKTRRARADANIAEMKEAEFAGSVIPIAVAETMISKEYATMRQKLENLGNTLAARTAQITDPAKVKATADKLVREALSALVGKLPDA